MQRILLILLLSSNLVIVSGQKFNPAQFEERVRFAGNLLRWVPESDIRINELLRPGFTIDSLEKFRYYFKDPQGNQITCYLHIKNLNIVTVEFTEKNASFKEIEKFLTEEKKFEFVGSEHLWSYFNNKLISVAISPLMEVHISRYNL